MALITQSSVKKCVTCEFWGGPRAASPSGREVRYKIKVTDGDMGVCAHKLSMKKGKPVRGGDMGCSRWTKWSVSK